MIEVKRLYHKVAGMLHRFGSMGKAEIVVRCRQAISKRMERIGIPEFQFSPSGPYLMSNECASPQRISSGSFSYVNINNDSEISRAGQFAKFHDTAPPRFFAGASHPRSHLYIANRMPDACKQILLQAENIHNGYFDLLGYSRLYFGNPVDWHLDPVFECRAPYIHWSRIDPLDSTVVGDSKIIWELNRHQWLLVLGQAYRHTGNERHAEKFAVLVRAWMRANPPGTGINWSSSLEVALRLISWCWALLLFRGSNSITPALYQEMSEWIRAHALHVERYLSHYFSPNTHITGEALGLFYASVLFPDMEEAERWRETGIRILQQQIELQVLPDGVYFEQTTCYQRYTIEFYLHYLILASRNGISVPSIVAERVQQMLDFLLSIRMPNGFMPQIGDTDGGSLLPIVQRTPDDFRAVFATAAAFFNRADYAWAAGELTPEVVWLLGFAGIEQFDSLSMRSPTTSPSQLHAEGGYVVMRNSWDKQAHQIIFDVGQLGNNDSCGHGHADLLSIQCACFGDSYLIDPGTFGYTADENWRDYFRGTAAHNTVMVDGLNQATTDGPFKWKQRPQARLRRWVSNGSFDLADAEHNAYHSLSDPVTHRRRVFFQKPCYWVVIDDLIGEDEHRIDLNMQFSPMEVSLGADNWAVARKPDGRECRFMVTATEPLKVELVAGQSEPIQGWVSSNYGKRQSATLFNASCTAKLPLRIVTLFFPVENSLTDIPVVVVSMQHQRIDIIFDDAVETLHIDDEGINFYRINDIPNEGQMNEVKMNEVRLNEAQLYEVLLHEVQVSEVKSKEVQLNEVNSPN